MNTLFDMEKQLNDMIERLSNFSGVNYTVFIHNIFHKNFNLIQVEDCLVRITTLNQDFNMRRKNTIYFSVDLRSVISSNPLFWVVLS